MTTEQQEAKRRAEVMLAFADGHTIQSIRAFLDWSDDMAPSWDWVRYNYRVSPNPVVNWDAMPAWANWVAMNKYSDWSWHVMKPKYGDDMWHSGWLNGFIPPSSAPKYAGTKPWHELIIERPKK